MASLLACVRWWSCQSGLEAKYSTTDKTRDATKNKSKQHHSVDIRVGAAPAHGNRVNMLFDEMWYTYGKQIIEIRTFVPAGGYVLEVKVVTCGV
jgi:hypothetical protein